MAPLHLERGFKRLTWAVSAFLAVFFAAEALSLWPTDSDAAYGFLAFGAISVIVPWVVFFVARWIVHGFVGTPEAGPPQDREPH